MNAAENVISKCGGIKKVREWLGVNLSTVYRFTYPRERSGTDGIIPAHHQVVLLRKAQEHGIDLGPADFFVAPASSSSSGEVPEKSARGTAL